jgi:hypothetical protein
VRIEQGVAVPAFKASGDITSMSQADGYIEIPADVEAVDAGTPVDVTLFESAVGTREPRAENGPCGPGDILARSLRANSLFYWS